MLVVTNGYKQVREIYIFAGVLVLQSLPFLAAAGLAHWKAAGSTTSPSGPSCSRILAVGLASRSAFDSPLRLQPFANTIVGVPAATAGEKQPEIVQ